jgi:hypothetical protein
MRAAQSAGAAHVIPTNQPLFEQRPAVTLYSWWRLPSGQVVELRRITGQHNPEVTVRNINEDGEMAAGEYVLTLRFLATHGKRVKG